jgi:hypothetical protein
VKFAFGLYELALAIVGLSHKIVGSWLTSFRKLLDIARGYHDNTHKGLLGSTSLLRELVLGCVTGNLGVD